MEKNNVLLDTYALLSRTNGLCSWDVTRKRPLKSSAMQTCRNDSVQVRNFSLWSAQSSPRIQHQVVSIIQLHQLCHELLVIANLLALKQQYLKRKAKGNFFLFYRWQFYVLSSFWWTVTFPFFLLSSLFTCQVFELNAEERHLSCPDSSNTLILTLRQLQQCHLNVYWLTCNKDTAFGFSSFALSDDTIHHLESSVITQKLHYTYMAELKMDV